MYRQLWLLIFAVLLFCTKSPQSDKTLFRAPLDSTQMSGWNIPPTRFTNFEGRKVFHLAPRSDSTAHPWVGDSTWRCYRIEIDMLAPDSIRRNFVGLDFHVQPDGRQSNNIGFFVGSDAGLPRVFEGAAHWNPLQVCWKLWPFASRTVSLPQTNWMTWRLDVGPDFVNVYVEPDSLPVYTVRDLPFSSGGIRFWDYGGSALFKDLKVISLECTEFEPELEDPWAEYRTKQNVQAWKISRIYSPDTQLSDINLHSHHDPQSWHSPVVDARGIVNVTATYPDLSEKATLFARGIIKSDRDTTRTLLLSYTDQITIWNSDSLVYIGPRRGWYDPGRSPADGFGRLLPALFQTPLRLKRGENEILVRHEINEPQFGSGFWLGLE